MLTLGSYGLVVRVLYVSYHLTPTYLVLRSSKVVQISSRVATDGERSRKTMPKLLYARTPQDTLEEQKVRKLANSRHAPADWI